MFQRRVSKEKVRIRRGISWAIVIVLLLFCALVAQTEDFFLVEGRVEFSFKPDPEDMVSVSLEVKGHYALDAIPGADFLFDFFKETWYQNYSARLEGVVIETGDMANFRLAVFDVEIMKSRPVEQEEIESQLIIEDFVDYQAFLPAFKINGYSETRIGDTFFSPVRVKTENPTYQSRFLQENRFFLTVIYDPRQVELVDILEGEDVWAVQWLTSEGILSIDGKFFRPEEGQEIVNIEWRVRDTADPGEVTYIIMDQVDLADPCDIRKRLSWINPPLNEFALRVLPADEPIHELKIFTYAPLRREGQVIPIYFLGQHLEDGEPSQKAIGYLYFDLDLIYNHSLLQPLYAIGKGGRSVKIEPTPDETLRIAGDLEEFGAEGLIFTLFCQALQAGKTTLSLGSFSEVDSLDTPLEPFPLFAPGWIRILP